MYYHSFQDHFYWLSDNNKTNESSKSDTSCYTRSDNGWTENLHPMDVFLKNTYEVLGPLHSATAHNVLNQLKFLNEDKTLRQATYGKGKNATKIIVNFGTTEARIKSELGADVVLPRWGFLIDGPRYTAFYALRWNKQEYENGALFTLQPQDDNNLKNSHRIRVFHAFGPQNLRWKNVIYQIKREEVIQP
jgi:hypothetical protein